MHNLHIPLSISAHIFTGPWSPLCNFTATRKMHASAGHGYICQESRPWQCKAWRPYIERVRDLMPCPFECHWNLMAPWGHQWQRLVHVFHDWPMLGCIRYGPSLLWAPVMDPTKTIHAWLDTCLKGSYSVSSMVLTQFQVYTHATHVLQLCFSPSLSLPLSSHTCSDVCIYNIIAKIQRKHILDAQKIAGTRLLNKQPSL